MLTEKRPEQRKRKPTRRLIAAGAVLVVAAVLALLLGVSAQSIDRVSAASGGGPEMALSLASGGTCDVPQTICQVTLGTKFEISVDVVEVPGGIYPGYQKVHAWVHYGDALGDQANAGSVKDLSVTWPDGEPANFLSTNTDQGGSANLDSISWASSTGLIAGATSFYTGRVYTVSLTCTSTESTTLIELLPLGESPAGTAGAKFQSFGIDIVPKVSDLTINCKGMAPTPTPTLAPGVGGIALDSDLRSLPLETAGADGSRWSVTLALAVSAASLAALCGAAWYAKRRWLA